MISARLIAWQTAGSTRMSLWFDYPITTSRHVLSLGKPSLFAANHIPDASTECQVSVLQLDPRLYLCVFGVASTEICCSYGPNQKEQPQMVRNHLGLFFVSDILKLFGGFYEDHWRTCYGPSSTGDPESVCSCRNRT